MIIDYLFRATDAAALHAVLDPLGYGFPAENDPDMGPLPARWGTKVIVQSVITGYELIEYTDDYGMLQSYPRAITASGYHLSIALNYIDGPLMALPECQLVTDRDAATMPNAKRIDYVLASRYSEEDMNMGWQVSPTASGSPNLYPFGPVE